MNNHTTTWLTVKEATSYLRCSKPTLYAFIRTNNITTAKLTRKTLVSRESIDQALANNKPHAAALAL
ncbi:MAG: DNA-binding protein [Chitinophagaceae bacterium]|nr:MAG: DNA-binding protein [Chitinophagaceae bacterium]